MNRYLWTYPWMHDDGGVPVLEVGQVEVVAESESEARQVIRDHPGGEAVARYLEGVEPLVEPA